MASTGPRTLVGKSRSRRNSLKHGIFANAFLLEGESPSEFNTFWKALRKDFDPQGILDETDVQRLAIEFWKLRRFLMAERALLERPIASPHKNREQSFHELPMIFVEYDGYGYLHLIRGIEDPVVREKCVDFLRGLRTGIAESGFNRDRDSAILRQLYGGYTNEMGRLNLYGRYDSWFSRANCSEDERRRNQYALPDQCVKHFLEELDAELDRINPSKLIGQENTKPQTFLQYISDALGLEQFLHYGAQIDKNIERILARLDRRQRMRRGHQPPPSIDVNIS